MRQMKKRKNDEENINVQISYSLKELCAIFTLKLTYKIHTLPYLFSFFFNIYAFVILIRFPLLGHPNRTVTLIDDKH